MEDLIHGIKNTGSLWGTVGNPLWANIPHLWLERKCVLLVLSSISLELKSKEVSCLVYLTSHFLFQETELFLSELVVSKTVFARIDRPAGIVTFSAHKESNEILNEWSHNLNTLMQLLNRTTHLITKEEMVHKLVQM